VQSLDLQQNRVTLDGLEALAHCILYHATAHPDRGLTARLKKDDNVVLPVMEVSLGGRVFAVDLLYNRLHEGGGDKGMQGALDRITQILERCGGGVDLGSPLFQTQGHELYLHWKEGGNAGTVVTSSMSPTAAGGRRRTRTGSEGGGHRRQKSNGRQ
jgi:hypothetical protein